MDFQVVVVDDSVRLENQAANRRHLLEVETEKLRYHGRAEQRHLVERLVSATSVNARQLERFTRDLGARQCDLGAVRNHILLLGLLHGGQEAAIIMIDDDVALVPTEGADGERSSSLNGLCRTLTSGEGAIVGGRLMGMPDMSAIERAIVGAYRIVCARAPELPPPRLSIGGGLFGFRAMWAEEVPFPRTYNEDWIWMLACQLLGASLKVCDAIGAHAWSPEDGMKRAPVIRELFGEIAFQGWYRALDVSGSLEQVQRWLELARSWECLINEERVYLNSEAARLAAAAGRVNGMGHTQVRSTLEILRRASIALDKLDSRMLARFADEYVSSWRLWKRVTSAVLAWRSAGVPSAAADVASGARTG